MEEGLFPSQRTLDEKGNSGLEEERRLAYVGLTRAKKAHLRQLRREPAHHGQWQSALPSRFIGECPKRTSKAWRMKASTAITVSFRDNQGEFNSTYSSPGWRRAQEARASGRERTTIIEATAKVVSTAIRARRNIRPASASFHQKFGYGRIVAVEGNSCWSISKGRIEARDGRLCRQVMRRARD